MNAKFLSKLLWSGVLFVVLATGTAFAQVSTVRGIVTDENREALPGVSILVKDTQVGTMTETDGTFALTDLHPDSYTLTFGLPEAG